MAEIVGAMLGLLAFMLGFTFSLAASRLDARRALVVSEANAIGTTFLRAGLLSEPCQGEIRKLLREYLKGRIKLTESVQPGEEIKRAEEIQGRLWVEAEAAIGRDPASRAAVLFISSLNELIDLHTNRVIFGLRNHIPTAIWAALYFLAVSTIGTMGYHVGLAGVRRFLVIIPPVLAFSVVMSLIADLDRPHKGLLRVSLQALVDLLDKWIAENPESKIQAVSSAPDSERRNGNT